MKIRRLHSYYLLLIFCSLQVHCFGQKFTYFHDSSVMNQFTVGETGVGSLTPRWYYDLFHSSYPNSAMSTNKQMRRTDFILSLNKQESYSESIDSSLIDRSRVEMLNVADRTPGITDLSWQVERSKIEKKLSILKQNIDCITMEGGSVSSYREWIERYNAITCGLQAVRDAYMPQSNRKEQYLAIYKDILLKTADVCNYLSYLRSVKGVLLDSTRIPKADIARIARSAHGRWKVSMTSVSGKK